jgi:hypothetical protein
VFTFEPTNVVLFFFSLTKTGFPEIIEKESSMLRRMLFCKLLVMSQD